MLYCPVNENKSSLGFATLTPRFFNSNTAGESSKFGFQDVDPTAAAVEKIYLLAVLVIRRMLRFMMR